MKQGWDRYKISDLCIVTDYVANGSFKSLKENVKYNYEEDFAIFLRIKDLNNNFKTPLVYVSEKSYNFLKKSFLLPGDIILCNVGSVGISHIVPNLNKPMTIAPNSMLVRPLNSEILDNIFLFYLINSPMGKILIKSITTGTTQSKFNKTNFRNLDIPIPPLDEQKRIVAKLDQCFEAIDKARANVKKNLQNAKELFQSKLNEIFSQKGDGWEEKKLGEVCEKITDGSHNPPKGQEDGLIMLSSRNITDNGLDFSKVRLINKDDFARENKRTNVQGGDVLLTIVGTIGRSLVYPKDAQKVVFQRSVAVLKPLKELNSYFLSYSFQCSEYQKLLTGNSRGVAQKGIYLKTIRGLSINIPPYDRQKTIVNQLDHLKSQTHDLESNYQQELDALDELKKSILDKAFNGEL